TGVSAVLLNEGRRENFDVMCLLGEARPNIPDSEAAAKLVGVVDQIFPEIKIDVSPLLEDAKMLEERMKKLKQQAKPAVVPKEEAVMYR
ncbi:MAG TPA: proteasome assembly chaperone family protein, partial [Euryarchaeota archaeon]|nr:proteasome assembly chaperone family protein [Euryarchaeota archaeon]